jgi:putative oxidoreductase
MAATSLLILRATLAVVLVTHGAHILFGVFASDGVGPGGLSRTAEYFDRLGLSPGFLMALLAGGIQFVGGLLVGAGWLTRWAALGVVGYLVIAVWKDHARWGFFLNWMLDPTRGHGLEFSLMLMGALISLVVAGGGDWSLDGLRAQSAASRAAGRARLRGRG